jgi:hypothetical protein
MRREARTAPSSERETKSNDIGKVAAKQKAKMELTVTQGILTG